MAKSLVGKFENRTDIGDRPPTVEEDLCLVIAERIARKGLPSEMPQTPLDAARWWVDMQERPCEFDNPRRIPLAGGDGHRWECPYHRRLEYTLRKFMGMKPEERRLILAAREDKVFWRGDDICFLMKQMVRRVTQDPEAAAERAAIQAE